MANETPPASDVDTTGAVGEPGAAPLGSAPVSGSDPDTTGTVPGNAPNPAAPPASNPDTSGAGTSSNLPSDYHPVDTSVTGTTDTSSSDGNVIRQANPAYRAPSAYPAASDPDTTWTDRLGTGPAPAETMSLYAGTVETGNIGAATSAKTITETLTFNTTGAWLSKAGVLPTAAVTVYDNTKSVALVETTDYTRTYSGEGSTTTLEITRVGTSTASADGDTVAVTYTYGDITYYESNLPASPPNAPTIGAVTPKNLAVTVNWFAPTGNLPITGYIVQCVPGYGTKYVAANVTATDFTQLQSSVPYQFRVAAMNERGQGAWSALSATATPLNTNAVPTGSLDPANTVNPIYNPDGTIKPGTGLGPS